MPVSDPIEPPEQNNYQYGGNLNDPESGCTDPGNPDYAMPCNVVAALVQMGAFGTYYGRIGNYSGRAEYTVRAARFHSNPEVRNIYGADDEAAMNLTGSFNGRQSFGSFTGDERYANKVLVFNNSAAIGRLCRKATP